MAFLKVILLLAFCILARGQVCVKRFIGGKWKSYGDCSEKQEILKGQIRKKAWNENGEAQHPTRPATESTTTNPWPGWEKSGKRYFKYFNDTSATYKEAKAVCEGYGGRLASEVLRDLDIVSYIASRRPKKTLTWIGFDDIVKEGDWTWLDGGAMNTNTTEWRSGEPNDLALGEEIEQDCGSIWNVYNHKIFLNDDGCYSLFSYICEI